ncbi:hypothetical protein [Hyphococcus sp. DH-69]|uniref:hypothetical protein n=1 Tax=Hyphococcus formosus TaxID=3143534 RepID=UPI00398A74FA
MSHNIRIGDALNESFQFGLRRWFTVFRLGWLPLLASGMAALGLQYLIFDMAALEAAVEAGANFNLAEVMRVSSFLAFGLMLIVFVFMIAVVSGLLASIYRLVALGEEREGYVDLRFDGPAQRVFWAQLIVTLINVSVILVFVVIAIPMTGSSFGEVFKSLGAFSLLMQSAMADPNVGQPDQATLEALYAPLGSVFLGVFVALLPLAYINIRLSPFSPGSAAENRLLFFGSLELTKGRFFSLLGLFFLFTLALLLVGIIYSLVTGIFEMMATIGGPNILAVIAMLSKFILFGLMVVYNIFIIGVQASLHAIIYRQLSTGE